MNHRPEAENFTNPLKGISDIVTSSRILPLVRLRQGNASDTMGVSIEPFTQNCCFCKNVPCLHLYLYWKVVFDCLHI